MWGLRRSSRVKKPQGKKNRQPAGRQGKRSRNKRRMPPGRALEEGRKAPENHRARGSSLAEARRGADRVGTSEGERARGDGARNTGECGARPHQGGGEVDTRGGEENLYAAAQAGGSGGNTERPRGTPLARGPSARSFGARLSGGTIGIPCGRAGVPDERWGTGE